ncbi:DUF5615 family PIN-like protein [Planctomycetota bacterium]
MRLLLDECVPRRLRAELSGYEVRTVPEQGWTATDNGELLRLAEREFDVFVTTDQNLKHQQSLLRRSIAVVVLVAPRIKLESLRPLVPELKRILTELMPGELREIGV